MIAYLQLFILWLPLASLFPTYISSPCQVSAAARARRQAAHRGSSAATSRLTEEEADQQEEEEPEVTEEERRRIMFLTETPRPWLSPHYNK